MPEVTKHTLNQAAAIAWTYTGRPAPTTLSSDGVLSILRSWDELVNSESVLDRYEAIALVTYAGVIAYDNPEVIQRVEDLYIREVTDHTRRMEAGIRLEEAGIHAEGEGYQDYMDAVKSAGLSTLSPRIYDIAMTTSGHGGGSLYAACVNPETTLALLLETHVRAPRTPAMCQDVLDHPGGAVRFGRVSDGMQQLAYLCEVAPDVVLDKRDRALAFVREHAKHYLQPVQRLYAGDELVYRWKLDMAMRHKALRILEIIGGPEDASLVQEIMTDPPIPPEERGRPGVRSEIDVRGAQLLDKWEAKEPRASPVQSVASAWNECAPLGAMAAAARVYEDFPVRDVLDEAELAPLLEAWDVTVGGQDIKAKFDLLRSVGGRVPKGYRLEGHWVLRYGNGALVDRIVDLYLDEHEKQNQPEGYPYSEQLALPEDGACNDLLPDFHDYLADLAYSTYAPRLYEQAWDASMQGSLKHAYLATVHPETTIEILLEAQLQKERRGKANHDYLWHPLPYVALGNLTAAFDLLAALCERAPETVLAQQDRVRAYVHRYALYYAKPLAVSYRDGLRYLWRKDHRLRRRALEVLELVAVPADAALVERLMTAPPTNPNNDGEPDLAALARDILDNMVSSE